MESTTRGMPGMKDLPEQMVIAIPLTFIIERYLALRRDRVLPGDLVTLIGRACDTCIRVEDLAAMAETIPYEITCGIGRRVRRIAVGGSRGADRALYAGYGGAGGGRGRLARGKPAPFPSLAIIAPPAVDRLASRFPALRG